MKYNRCMSEREELARPSLRLRATIAIALLLGFYAVTLSIAACLVGIALLLLGVSLYSGNVSYGTLLGVVIAGLPGLLLAWGVLQARPPRFEPKGRELSRGEAPRLFALLDELADATKTAAPARVFLLALPDLGVTQVGGTLGIGSTRVLVLGAPLLDMLDVGQLRGALAHEYGHFVGGDTRLSGILAYTRALFISVLQSTRRAPFAAKTHFAVEAGAHIAEALGGAIARLYARLFFRITHALSRRQEVLADVLAADVAGSAQAIAALEISSTIGLLYELYVRNEVAFAIDGGALPEDVLEGFAKYRERMLASEEGKLLLAKVRTRETDRFDTHPSLAERTGVLTSLDRKVPRRPGDEASAMSLVDEADVQSWLAGATLALFERPVTLSGPPPLERMPWAEIPARIFAPRAREQARGLAERLHPMFPAAGSLSEMFAAVTAALEANGLYAIASTVEPRLTRVHPSQQMQAASQVGAQVLAALFQGALLERGARVGDSIGAPCLVWNVDGEDVLAAKIVAEAFASADARASIGRWAARLAVIPERAVG